MTDKDGKPHLYKLKKSDSRKLNSFEEVLKALDKADPGRKVWLHLEFRGGSEELVKETYRLLKLYSREGKSIWGHYDDSVANSLSNIGPEIKRLASPGEIHQLYLQYFLGFLPYKTIPY